MVTMSLALLMIVILLLRPVVKLLKHRLQLFRDGQAEMGGILKQGYALIRQVEEDHSSPEHADTAEHLHIQQMADTDQCEDEHFAEDALKADVGKDDEF